jgi:hypothetical protein
MPGDDDKIAMGMDVWQVRESIGPPEKRKVISGNGPGRTEIWSYGGKHLYFVDGFLTLALSHHF